jgi:hypothetical protein
MFIDEMSWKQFSNLAAIRALPINEQVRKYNFYLNDIMQARMNYIHHQTQVLGGNKPKVIQQEGLPSGCIEFIYNTTGGTNADFNVTTSGPTNYTITWGDGTDDAGEIDGVLNINHEYADSDTEYTVRLCFDDISLVTELDFED